MLPIARNIIHMLMDKDLLTQSEVVDGSSIFSVARQRNRFCYFKRANGTSFFIKTGHETEPSARRAMALEAKFYDHFATQPAFADLSPFLTKLFDFDPETGTLISEFIEGGEDLSVVATQPATDMDGHLAQLAQCLSILHTRDTSTIDLETFGFDTAAPWIFRVPDRSGPLPQLRSRSVAGAKTIDKIVSNETWMTLLNKQLNEWAFGCLIHGDIKPQNFLVHGQATQTTQYKLIDWERAKIGDPAWDVACGAVIPIILRVFELSNQNTDMSVKSILTASVCSDVNSFLAAYRTAARERGLAAVTAHRCTDLITARLLAAAYEVSFATDQLNPITDVLLEIAEHLSEGGAPKLFLRSVAKSSKAA